MGDKYQEYQEDQDQINGATYISYVVFNCKPRSNCKTTSDMYGNPTCGYKFYGPHLNVKVIRGSNEEYFEERFLEGYFEELMHSFVSIEGKAESYNGLFKDTEKTKYFKTFISFNPKTGGHFQTKEEKHSDEAIEDRDYDLLDEVEEDEDEVEGKLRNSMHELHRKTLQTGFYNHQVKCELQERDQTDEWTFGPKEDPQDPRRKISYSESLERYMTRVDELRREEIYDHKCSLDCRRRGCGSIIVMDGNWNRG